MKDQDKIHLLLDELNETANSFSIKLNYNSPSSIYHIINGINGISEGFILRVITQYPNVNYSFLKNGEYPILLPNKELPEHKNSLSSKIGYDDLPQILKNIELLLIQINKKIG